MKKREAREGYAAVNEAIFVVQKAGGTTHRSFLQNVKSDTADTHSKRPSKPKQQLRYTELQDGTTNVPDLKGSGADDLFAMNLSPLEEKKHGGQGKKAKAGKKKGKGKGKGKKKRKSKKKKNNSGDAGQNEGQSVEGSSGTELLM